MKTDKNGEGRKEERKEEGGKIVRLVNGGQNMQKNNGSPLSFHHFKKLTRGGETEKMKERERESLLFYTACRCAKAFESSLIAVIPLEVHRSVMPLICLCSK